MSVRCRIVLLIAALLPPSVSRAEDGHLIRRVYPVADLIVSMRNAEKSDGTASAPASFTGWAVSREIPPANVQNQLVQLITNTIAPRSWDERGGPGAIEYFPLNRSLVVNQSPAIQEQIADLLASLRRLYDIEVAVEVKLVLIVDEVFQNLKRGGILGDPKTENHAQSEPRGIAFLNDRELFLLMEALQDGTRAKVIQASKLVVGNGQTTRCNTGGPQTYVTGLDISQRDGRIVCRPKTEVIPLGTQVCLRPLVSADRRFVQLQLDAIWNQLPPDQVPRLPITMPRQPDKDSPSESKPEMVTQYIEQPRLEKIHLEQPLVIPDANTAVLTCWQLAQVHATRTEVPILGDLPYVGELFRTTEYQEEKLHLLILVTPRIVVAQEKEEKALPNPSARSCPKESARSVAAPPTRLCTVDCRTPIIATVRPEETPQEAEPPDEAQILRAMPPIENPIPGIIQVSHDNIQIVTEKLADKVDPPRSFPLVGPARLHHGQWKCSVYYTETVESAHPALEFRLTKPKVQVLYVEKDWLQP